MRDSDEPFGCVGAFGERPVPSWETAIRRAHHTRSLSLRARGVAHEARADDIVWTWDAVQPYVAEQRRLRDSGGAHRMAGDGMYFEYLAARALAYRKRAFRGKTRVNPPVPEAYRERLREALATGQDVAPQLMR